MLLIGTPSYLYVDDSRIPNAGAGLFAREDLSKNKYLGEYTGKVITTEEALEDGRSQDYLFELDKKKGLYLDGIGLSNILRYINHSSSSNPNVYVKREKKKQSPYPSIKFYTNRKIYTGEELYFDYGYHPADPKTW